MTADSDFPLASAAPVGPRRRDGRTRVGRVLAAVLLMIGCMSAGGTASAVESLHSTGSPMPSTIDELSAPVTDESSLRHRIAVTRRRFGRAPRRVDGVDDSARFAHWLPVQFRLMPPFWRGPTVLRL